ncbi:MAG TPA: rhodanese-like domain-containing protein [Stellaceae bacterium]|nr:rhodanese-like domain-containing protein [Stellaceae bacterium]
MPPLVRPFAVLIFAFAAIGAARAQDVTDVAAVPHLAPADRAQYQHYLDAPQHKAFAIGPNGQYGWSSGRDGWFMAELGAVYNCNKAGRVLCEVYAADDALMYASYAGNIGASAGLLPQLHGKHLANAYAGELDNDGVPPLRALHAGNQPGPTPVAIPGARLITTRYVADALAGSSPPVLIDVDDDGGLHHTLPRALWLRGAGDDADKSNAALYALFRTLLNEVAPRKDTPLIIFCGSPQCWSGYNAALRAVSMGYINVNWYRGGIAAWDDASLPIVHAVLVAQLW